MYDKAIELINQAQHILVVQADNPDGDSLGTALALEHILGDLSKKVDLYCGVELSTYLRFLPGWDRVRTELPHTFDLSIIVDTSATSLLEIAEKHGELTWLRTKPCIVIDHHTTEATIDFATVTVLDPKAVATSEVIYDMAKVANWKISAAAADLLAGAILSDSLGLTTQGTTSKSIRTMADLVDLGANLAELDSRRKDTYRKAPELIHYKGQLLERVEYSENNEVAYVHIPWSEIETYSPHYNPSMLVLEDMRLTEGTKVAIAFKQYKDGKITAKIRANYGFPIANKLAEHFGGGGHPYASGFKIQDGRAYEEIKTECISVAHQLVNDMDQK